MSIFLMGALVLLVGVVGPSGGDVAVDAPPVAPTAVVLSDLMGVSLDGAGAACATVAPPGLDLDSLATLKDSDPEIYEHFARLIAARDVQGISPTAVEPRVSIKEFRLSVQRGASSELMVSLERGEERRLFVFSEDHEGCYRLAMDAVITPQGGASEILSMDGDALGLLLPSGVEQDGEKMGDATTTATVVTATCSLSEDGKTYCCTFTRDDGKIRIYCICRVGSGPWTVCYDSGWI